MTYTEPTLTHIDSFIVSGVSVRTKNSDEFNQATAKLPDLWNRFYTTMLADLQPGSPIYGVYSDYESDANGLYTVTAGLILNNQFTTKTPDAIKIQSGNYLVFQSKGAMPQAVIDAWKNVWNYFDSKPTHQRQFISDVETYSGSDEVALHIGVK